MKQPPLQPQPQPKQKQPQAIVPELVVSSGAPFKETFVTCAAATQKSVNTMWSRTKTSNSMKQCINCNTWTGPNRRICAYPNCNTEFPKPGKAKNTQLCKNPTCKKSFHHKRLKCPKCNTEARKSAKVIKVKKAAAAKALVQFSRSSAVGACP